MKKKLWNSKLLTSLMILCLTFLLPGCSGKQSNTNTEGTVTPVASTIPEAITTPEETVTLTPTVTEELMNPEVDPDVALTPLGFYVTGTKLLDSRGNEFVFRGINHAHTWYKSQLSTALTAIAATGSNSVRVVLSNGEQWTKDSAQSVTEIITKCKELNMIAILEVHDATGKNDLESLLKATEYFIEIKDALLGNEAYVIINIANEWYGEWKGKDWAKGYQEAIPMLRAVGLTHTILVDSAGWGQYPDSIAQYGVSVFEADPLKNTMFAIHMYEYAGGDAETIKKNIDAVLEKNLCVSIGEFGYKHSNGDVDEAYLLEYCEELGIGYLGWSWKGNGGGVEYLDIAVTWDGTELSADWGDFLINSEFGIRTTAKTCTIFE